MHMGYARVFPRRSVENPVENVEKSTESTQKPGSISSPPAKRDMQRQLHKPCFFLHFQNYVAIEFPRFFEENSAKSSVFRDLLRKRTGGFGFMPQIFVKIPQKYGSV